MRSLIKNILKTILGFLPVSQHPVIPANSPQVRWRIGWIKGWLWFRPLWAIRYKLGFGPHVTWGQRVSVWGYPLARGTGRIEIGNDVILDGQATLFVYTNALLKIGNCTIVNTTRFGCTSRIEIGDYCLIADARIMDSDFHNTGRQRLSPDAPVTPKPIKIGNNCWVAGAAVILKGVQMEDHSILAFGALATRNIPEGRIFGGNPARDCGPVKDTKFREKSTTVLAEKTTLTAPNSSALSSNLGASAAEPTIADAQL